MAATGTIQAINLPLITVSGLSNVRPQEVVVLDDGNTGVVLHCDQNQAHVMLLEKGRVSPKASVKALGEGLTIPLGESVLGNVLSPLGQILFGQVHDEDARLEYREIDTSPVSLQQRAPIKKFLFTGVSLVDSLLPLAQGQRELVLGDRKTGKTLFLQQAALAHIQQGGKVVFCLIGKRKEDIKHIADFFAEHEVLDSIVVVASSALDPSSQIILTPFTAMTVAEYLRDKGEDTLVVFDDLTTHAKFYREVALLGRSFPGRDSYPGDIFYVHARLLERAGNFALTGTRKTASITALPVAETLESELTDYIVSNLISITDGHLLFDTQLLAQGQKPPLNVNLSVTRVGKQTQTRVQRTLTQKLSVFFHRYEKTLRLTHFGSELSEEARLTLQRGNVLQAFLNQDVLEIVPHDVQLLGAVMILEGWWDSEDPTVVPDLRRNLSEHYRLYKKEHGFLHELSQVETLDELQKKLAKHKKLLDEICHS